MGDTAAPVHAALTSSSSLHPLSTPHTPQRLLAGVLPLAAMAYLFPSRFHARAWEMPPTSTLRRPASKAQQLFKWPTLSFELPAAVAELVEELLILLRAVYLSALFAPVLLSAPLVWGLGEL
jgi:hypothetical protein